MTVLLDESRYPVVVLRTGDIGDDADVEELFIAFERLFAIGPVGLALEWGRVSRDCRLRIAEFRQTHDGRFNTAVLRTVSIVAPAAVDANRLKAGADEFSARSWYAGSVEEAIVWLSDRMRAT
jgi:hypothetical protein